jgi:predicted phosphodiesterase
MRLCSLTDLHLERVDKQKKAEFLARLRGAEYDAAVITGDISHARGLPVDLEALGEACAPYPLYFVLGNHDFYGSSFDAVDAAVDVVCKRQRNLKHLGHGEIVHLTEKAALIGHRGWADGRAGYGSRTYVPSSDAVCIKDLQGKPNQTVLEEMENLGKASGQYFREILPLALTCYKHIWIATHVAPFKWSAFYDGRLCGPLHLPHYINLSAGGAIRGIAGQFAGKSVTVLCGHTHSPVIFRASDNVTVHAGRARPGHPQVQRIFEIENIESERCAMRGAK